MAELNNDRMAGARCFDDSQHAGRPLLFLYDMAHRKIASSIPHRHPVAALALSLSFVIGVVARC